MKFYICKNCSGFHWFEMPDFDIHDVLSEYVDLEKVGALSSILHLPELMNYAEYEVIFLKVQENYVLSIRNIPEQGRIDAMGRPLHINLIWQGSNTEFEILHKILLYYLSYKADFEKWLDSLFGRGRATVNCKIKEFASKLIEINKCKILNTTGIGGLKTSMAGNILCLGSDCSDHDIANNLNLDLKEVVSRKQPLTSMIQMDSPWIKKDAVSDVQSSVDEDKFVTQLKIELDAKKKKLVKLESEKKEGERLAKEKEASLNTEIKKLQDKIELLRNQIQPVNQERKWWIAAGVIGFIIGYILGTFI